MKPQAPVLNTLKQLGILSYRGRSRVKNRAADAFLNPNERARDGQAIEVVKSRRAVKSCPVRELNAKRCLTALHRAPVKRKNSPSLFAVPNCMFVNICSLSKTKNRVRAPVALEADMRNNDIDVCVVSDIPIMQIMQSIAGTGIGRERICGKKAVLRFISGKLRQCLMFTAQPIMKSYA